MKRLLLDTNAYGRFFGGDSRVLNVLGEAETIYVSVIVMGELFAGFRGGRKLQENSAQLSAFRKKAGVRDLEVTSETAEIFGQVKSALRQAGTPIPINDIWIASQALETGSVVATYDEHFSAVPGIRLWNAPVHPG